MSAADCSGCGLPVATPADAGSWTPDGTVCWRGGRCEVPVTADADADYEHALGGLRGHIVYGEQTAGDTPVAWVQVKVALPYLRDAERALVAERTRAVAAEAECARLTTERDAARAEAAGLRAVVEGRTVPPTPQEIAAHHDASGSGWLVSSDRDVIPYTLCRSEARDGGAPDGARWWPLDASGRPCVWPTPALDAAGEGR